MPDSIQTQGSIQQREETGRAVEECEMGWTPPCFFQRKRHDQLAEKHEVTSRRAIIYFVKK